MDWNFSLHICLSQFLTKNNRAIVLVLSLSVSLTCLFPVFCFSHEEQPSILDFEIKATDLLVTIQTDMDRLFNSGLNNFSSVISEEVNETGHTYENNLENDKVRELLFQNWPLLSAKFFFRANDEDLKLELTTISIDGPNTQIEPISITLKILAQIPDESDYLTFGWSNAFGDLVIRQQGAEENLYSDYLSKGATSAQIDLKTEEMVPSRTRFLSYVISGVYHIIPLGYDHILFIVGLYLFSSQLRPLVFQASLFTLAHSLSLILASLNIINVPGSIVEPIIALSIIYIGFENYFKEFGTPYRNFLILGFGLLHGLGFASVLGDLKLASHGIILPLLAFNIGVEIGQILILLGCFCFFGYWFREKAWYRSRIVKPLSGFKRKKIPKT